MNEVATNISHPNWIKLETILKSVSDVIFEIAEFYIDKKNENGGRQEKIAIQNNTKCFKSMYRNY